MFCRSHLWYVLSGGDIDFILCIQCCLPIWNRERKHFCTVEPAWFSTQGRDQKRITPRFIFVDKRPNHWRERSLFGHCPKIKCDQWFLNSMSIIERTDLHFQCCAGFSASHHKSNSCLDSLGWLDHLYLSVCSFVFAREVTQHGEVEWKHAKHKNPENSLFSQGLAVSSDTLNWLKSFWALCLSNRTDQ